MPYLTEHYNLIAFLNGEIYSASADRKRFTILDNQLWFLSSQVGDGIISGWTLTDKGSLNLEVSDGLGIVNGFTTQTNGNINTVLQDNKKNYVYLQRKDNVIGEVSSFSNLSSLDYTDLVVPPTPTGLVFVTSEYNSISIEWDEVTVLDFDYYEIWRSADNITFSLLDNSYTNSYEDTISITQSATYFYKIKSVDKNGLKSGFSSTLTAYTSLDERIPSNPSNLEIVNGNGQLQIIWDIGEILVDSHEVTVQEVDTEGIEIGVASTYSLSGSQYFLFIPYLTNNSIYKITVKSISYSGIYSDGVSSYGTPLETLAPQEFSSFTISDYKIDDSGNVGINLDWTLEDDEYLLSPASYIINIQAEGETGIKSTYLTNNLTIENYTVEGDEVRNILENKRYRIELQTSDSDGNVSAQYILRIKTQKYTKPLPITNLTITTIFDINTRSFIADWDNSNSEFSYNSLKIEKRTVGDLSWTTIINNENIKQTETYSLDQSFIENDTEYKVSITVFDLWGNESPITIAFSVISVELSETYILGDTTIDEIRPIAPSNVVTYSGNNQVVIFWAAIESTLIDSYKIYRAEYSNGLYFAEDFSLVADIPASNMRKFIDYTVVNDHAYAYFMTSVDIFGKESPNPSDGVVEYQYQFGEPRNSGQMTDPTALSLTQNGYSVELSWQLDEQDFDGYEIWRSIGNNYSWQKIDSVGNFEISYTDTDILAVSGTYYYMVRKYRNEAKIIVSTSKIVPVDSINLGIVTVSNGLVTNIDLSNRVDIYLLRTPIRNEIANQFKDSPFVYISPNDDRRIRLSDNLTVSDWTTEDYQTYTTEFDLRGTDEYYIYINNLQSNFSGYVDKDEGTLTFTEPIYKGEENEVIPTVYVIFLDTSQAGGTLKSKNISDNIIANKLLKGKLHQDNVPIIDHFGRYKEDCFPERTEITNRLNVFSFSDSLISGKTFYDIIKTSDGRYLAGTSEGILLSLTTDASRWTNVYSSKFACHKLYYSGSHSLYLGILGNEVVFSSDLTTWTQIPGIENVSIVRDIEEDNSGNVFISTDQGIFFFNPISYTKDFWETTSEINGLDNSAYSLLFDSTNDLLITSNNEGVWSSSNSGQSWNKISNIKSPFFAMINYGGYYFACSSHRLWRKGPLDSDFTIISSFDFEIRNLRIFNETLYITTDGGLYKSNQANFASLLSIDNLSYEIWDDFAYDDWYVFDLDSSGETTGFFVESKTVFVKATERIKLNNFIQKVFGISIIDNRLWLCLDNKLYSIDSSNISYLHSEESSVCPTIFVDDVERSVGVYYTVSSILFDEAVNKESKVEIVKKYDVFFTKDGGWIDQKYDASLTLFVNNVEQKPPKTITTVNNQTIATETLVKPSTLASDISSFLGQISLPSFGARNSNYEDAFNYYKLIVQKIDEVVVNADFFPDSIIESSTINNIFNYINLFKINIYDDIQSLIVIPEMTGTSTATTGLSWTYDVVSGKIVILGGLLKYSFVNLSIKDAGIINIGELTHKEIEDRLEEVNSGLGLGFANIQQSNIIKTGIYNNLIDPFGQYDKGLIYQARYLGSCDNALNNWDYSYDNEDGLSFDLWYQQLKSTINYELINDFPIDIFVRNGQRISGSFSIDYPNDILYLSDINEVWVCGIGGIISISTSTYETSVILSEEYSFNNLSLDGDYVYAMSDGGLFKININTKESVKDVDFSPPSSTYNSILQFGDSRYVSDSEGLHLIRPYEDEWRKILDIKNCFVRQTPNLSFCIGTDPNDSTIGLIFYSFAGVVWNRSNQFEGIMINNAVQRGSYIYYATDKGLIVEDLSSLFGFSETSEQPEFIFTDLNNDEEPDAIPINDVDGNTEYAIACDYEGYLYKLKGSEVTSTVKSSFDTIHKVRIINNKWWSFSNNEIEIEDYSKIIQLSTGKSLI